MPSPSLPATYSEALEIVHELATQNQIDGNDVAFGDAGLEDEAERQSTALTTVEEFATNHTDGIDDLPLPASLAAWPVEAFQADPGDDQTQVLPALKTVLDMARHNTLDPDAPTTEADDLVDEAKRQTHAVAMVEDMVARHGVEIAKVVSIDVGPAMR